jgi:hypothetical protein
VKTIYSEDTPFNGNDHALFLAGPSPRDPETPSWRPQAISLLAQLGYQGTVLIPEWRNWSAQVDYQAQVEWEYAGLSQAKAIVIWVPRNMVNMPALTTNVEFGYWLAKRPTHIFYGRPNGAPHTAYLDWLYSKHHNISPFDNLEGLLEAAIEK